ncbi:hypothetical protein BGZ47_003226, partial [Haplosporangium gracile]
DLGSPIYREAYPPSTTLATPYRPTLTHRLPDPFPNTGYSAASSDADERFGGSFKALAAIAAVVVAAAGGIL